MEDLYWQCYIKLLGLLSPSIDIEYLWYYVIWIYFVEINYLISH